MIDLDEFIGRILKACDMRRDNIVIAITTDELFELCMRVRELLLSQPMLLEVQPPLNILGDLHGQLPDLLRWFHIGGFPPAANYLFLGDYVDRGKYSLQTIALLFAYKLKYPTNFFCCAETTSVPVSIAFMGFMTIASGTIPLNYGKRLAIVLIACPWQPSWTVKYFVAMGAFRPIWDLLIKFVI